MHGHHHPLLFSTSAFFLFGFLGSLHCLSMCGPLSLFFMREGVQLKYLVLYQTFRLFSYTLLGILLGTIGMNFTPPPASVAFILGGFLLLYAGGISLPTPRFLTQISGKALKKAQKLSPQVRASLTGFLTPLIPCGLLYGAVLAAGMAHSPLEGGWWMFCFGAGTLPLLAMSQMGFHLIATQIKTKQKISPKTILRLSAFIAGTSLIIMTLHHQGFFTSSQ